MLKKWTLGLILVTVAVSAQADASAQLRQFIKTARTGSAEFTQTVFQPDGTKSKQSKGQFEFERPGRFRFSYQKPYAQVIVADGQRLWSHDIDLEQVVSRAQAEALNATPAALLTGTDIENNYMLINQAPTEGIEWVTAIMRKTSVKTDPIFSGIKIGFKDKGLAALEVTDTFGQRTLLTFDSVRINLKFAPGHFKFTVPPRVDVIHQ